MFLDYKMNNDHISLMIITGPLEKYDPKKNKEVVEMFEKVNALNEEIKEMRKSLDPKIKEITTFVEQFNKNFKQQNKKTPE